MPYVENLPEAEEREVIAAAFAGLVSSVVLQSIAFERRLEGSPLPMRLLTLWLMFEPKGRREWEYQLEQFALAWMKANATEKIRARRGGSGLTE
jgi:hypothetical protein